MLCPLCGRECVVDEDWSFGRVVRCGIHYRNVERFDKLPAPDLLDEQEKNDAA